MYCKNLLIIFLIFTVALLGQDNFENELKKNRSRLDEIKDEITALKEQLSVSKKQALSISDQVALINKEMSLLARSKGLLQTEQKILERRQKNNETNIIETKEKLKKLKDLYADRLRYMYKYGKIKNMELLLTSASFNQAFERYRFLKIIADYDEKTIKSITQKQQEIETLQKQIADDLTAIEISIASKQQEEKRYQERKEERNALLSKLSKNQKYFQNQISVKTLEQQKLTSYITALEKTRKAQAGKTATEEFVTIDFDNFNKGKGK